MGVAGQDYLSWHFPKKMRGDRKLETENRREKRKIFHIPNLPVFFLLSPVFLYTVAKTVIYFFISLAFSALDCPKIIFAQIY